MSLILFFEGATRKRGPAKGKAGTASTSAPVEEEVVEEPALPAPAPEHEPEETTGTNTPPAKSEPELEDNSKRVEVTIIGPDGELIKFKARPKHAIKKILVAACKNYEVEWEMYVVFFFILYVVWTTGFISYTNCPVSLFFISFLFSGRAWILFTKTRKATCPLPYITVSLRI